MNSKKKLGIWMDHAEAHLMEYKEDPIETTVITSNFTHQQKSESMSKGENLMHNQEKRMHAEYYHKLIDSIRNYSEVLLFGPTHAKEELNNLIKADNHLVNIKIEIKSSERMSENQEHAFVRDHFASTHKQ